MSKKMMIFYSFPNNFSLKILNDLNDRGTPVSECLSVV